jgi:hypothetical protein
MEVAFRDSIPAISRVQTEIETHVTRQAPFRFLVLWTMALLIAGAMVSSSARALALGEAMAASALGQPLRVLIPVTAAPSETIAADCFGLAPPGGDAAGAIVTAKVSLERAAAGLRLAVTTSQAVGEPVVRLTVRGGCGEQTRRDYVLLLDPPATGERLTNHAAAAEASVPIARAPGQERSASTLAAAARRDAPERSGTGDARLAQRPVGVERMPRLTPAVLQLNASAGTGAGGSFQHVAALTESGRVTPAQHSEPTLIDRSKDLWWTIAVALGGLVIIVLGALLVRQGRPASKAPAWSSGSMHGRTQTRARSVTNLSAVPVTLAHTHIPADALLTRAGPTTRSWVAPANAVTLPNVPATKAPNVSAVGTRSRANRQPASGPPDGALDTLLNEIDSDLNVERAVRQVHAAARNHIERDIGSDAILRAIEAAERDLMMVAPAPAETAMGHALDNELLGGKPQPKKAAA